MSRTSSALVLAVALALALPTAAYAKEDAADGSRAQAPTVTIDGLGFGHGRGLSQYGALGRANAGQGYAEIVKFYYPGTKWGRAGGKVKVLITADTSRDVVVRDRTGLTVRALKSGRSWKPSVKRATKWRIDPVSRGRSKISYKTGGWHTWRTVNGEAEFSAGGKPLTLHTGSGAVAYRGVLRSAAPGSGRDRDTVNIVSLDGYLKGVVPREVPALWPTQAVRAQSVAARTYAAFERADAPGGRHYQICDTAHCQVYGGHSAEHPASNAAIRATKGRVLTSGGEPAFTQFSASNGGWTVAGAFDYLPAQEDTFDEYDPDGGPVGWQVSLDGNDVTKHWTDLGALESITVDEKDGNGQWGGRALSLTVTGANSSVQVAGSTFAFYLGLRSNWIDLEVTSAD